MTQDSNNSNNHILILVLVGIIEISWIIYGYCERINIIDIWLENWDSRVRPFGERERGIDILSMALQHVLTYYRLYPSFEILSYVPKYWDISEHTQVLRYYHTYTSIDILLYTMYTMYTMYTCMYLCTTRVLTYYRWHCSLYWVLLSKSNTLHIPDSY